VTRAFILHSKRAFLALPMDCRFKPGNDGISGFLLVSAALATA
jgi:hypothetical protein